MSKQRQSSATAAGVAVREYRCQPGPNGESGSEPALPVAGDAPAVTAAQVSRGAPTASVDATIDLLRQIRAGDDAALGRLLHRSIPRLLHWAHGRLPPANRGMLETRDLVQDTVIATLGHLDALEVEHPGALQAYLRTCIKNRIRDVIRQQGRRPHQVEFPEEVEDTRVNPHKDAERSENMARYEMALRRLSAADRAAIVARVQWQYSYSELAVFLGKSSEAAARMAVGRAMKRLASELQEQK